MNTSNLVAKLADNWDMSKAETRRLLDTIVEKMSDNLSSGKAFTIPHIEMYI